MRWVLTVVAVEGALAFGTLAFVPARMVDGFGLSASAAGGVMVLYGVGGLIYSYRLLDNNFGAIKSPLYVGGSIERGNIWDSSGAIELGSMLNAGSIYVGSDTFLGPVYLAYGQAQGGADSFYLFFGNTFGL